MRLDTEKIKVTSNVNIYLCTSIETRAMHEVVIIKIYIIGALWQQHSTKLS